MPDDEPLVGGRYRLRRTLASGGMGTVWEAWDETLRRSVAVKRMHLMQGISETDRQQAVDRAMREARLAARLHHPNAVGVYDVVDEADGPCLVMQYVPSRNLAEVVRAEGPLPVHTVARIGTQLAAALAAAHRAGIVHRDVKPGNVLIADDGTAHITDFGVSHAFDDVTVTSTSMVSGTPAYLAPEVARGAESTFASDVYSLGATLYLACEGRPPFGDDENPMAVLHRVASGRPDPPRRAGSLTWMLQDMMAAAPGNRPGMVDIAGRLVELHPLGAGETAPPTESQTQVIPRQDVGRAAAPAPAPMPNPRPASAQQPPAAAPPLPPPTSDPGPVPFVETTSEPADRGEDRRRALIPILAVVLVVALGAILAVVLLGNASDSDDDQAADPPATSAAPSSSASSSESTSAAPSSTSPKPSTSSESSSSSSNSSSEPAGAPTDDELANALTTYFNLVPKNLDEGWDRLTPEFQKGRARNRATYDDYWNSVRNVEVRNVEGHAPDSATALLIYHYKNGKNVRSNARLTFVRQDGVLKIKNQS